MAVFFALAASAFGMMTVSIYAKMVIRSPPGNKVMWEIGEIIHKAALTFLHTE